MQTHAQYLPHRRQRPLAETSHEYKVLTKVAPEQSRLNQPTRMLAVVLGLIAGLSTVGTGALVLPLKAGNSAQVAGLQTTEVYNPSPSPVALVNSEQTCWNQVDLVESQLVWRNSCQGQIPTDGQVCVLRQTPLTSTEQERYRQWYESDQVLPVECQAIPEEILKNPFR